jgi:hypothetical protein
MRLVNFDEGAWVALLFDMTVQKKKFWERQTSSARFWCSSSFC